MRLVFPLFSRTRHVRFRRFETDFETLETRLRRCFRLRLFRLRRRFGADLARGLFRLFRLVRELRRFALFLRFALALAVGCAFCATLPEHELHL